MAATLASVARTVRARDGPVSVPTTAPFSTRALAPPRVLLVDRGRRMPTKPPPPPLLPAVAMAPRVTLTVIAVPGLLIRADPPMTALSSASPGWPLAPMSANEPVWVLLPRMPMLMTKRLGVRGVARVRTDLERARGEQPTGEHGRTATPVVGLGFEGGRRDTRRRPSRRCCVAVAWLCRTASMVAAALARSSVAPARTDASDLGDGP